MNTIEIGIGRSSMGYSAYTTDEALAVVVGGATLAEVKEKMLVALNLQFEGAGHFFTERDLKITLSLQQFFEFYKVINVAALAVRLGIPQSLLAQYIGGQKKPKPKQAARIVEGIHVLGRELAAIKFS